MTRIPCVQEGKGFHNGRNDAKPPSETCGPVRKEIFRARNGRRIQLVTTTHETRIMSHDIVRRDEIWICDTNGDESTRLFSLEDEQVRIDKVMDENYMKNVWGGVPVFEGEEEKEA